MKQTMPDALAAHLNVVSAAEAEREAFARRVFDATVVECERAEGFDTGWSMWDVSFERVMRRMIARQRAEQKAKA